MQERPASLLYIGRVGLSDRCQHAGKVTLPCRKGHSALLVYCTLGKVVCLTGVSVLETTFCPASSFTSGKVVYLTCVSVQETPLTSAMYITVVLGVTIVAPY